MSTDQEYWDACLIKAWRDGRSIRSAMSMFYSITKKRVTDCELLRSPKGVYTGTGIGAKLFVAQYMPKLGDWLFEQPRERDVELLKKLAASNYDRAKKPRTGSYENELSQASRTMRRTRLRMGMERLSVIERNHSTDWGVTKGARSKTK